MSKRKKRESERIDDVCCFMELRNDVKLKIMEYLSESDLMKLSCVCSELRDLVWTEDYLWKKLLEKFEDPDSNPEWSWNDIFGTTGTTDFLFGLCVSSLMEYVKPPVSIEDEIRAFLRQQTPVTIWDLVTKFRSRLHSKEEKDGFAAVLRRISKMEKTTDGRKFIVLRK